MFTKRSTRFIVFKFSHSFWCECVCFLRVIIIIYSCHASFFSRNLFFNLLLLELCILQSASFFQCKRKECSSKSNKFTIHAFYLWLLLPLLKFLWWWDGLCCRTLGSSNFTPEAWHGRSKEEERSLRLIKVISLLWLGWGFLNLISLALEQRRASVTDFLAFVNRLYSLFFIWKGN